MTGVTVKGKAVFIDFEPKPSGNKPVATFSTSDPDIIEALEEDSRFGSTWVTVSDDTEGEEIPTEKEAETTKVPADVVGNFQQARKYLITQFGYTPLQVSTTDEVVKVARAKNIEFLGWTPNKSTKTQ